MRPLKLTIQAFVKVMPGWNNSGFLRIVEDSGLRYTLRPYGHVAVSSIPQTQHFLDAIWWLAPGENADELMYRFVIPNQSVGSDLAVLALR